MIRRILFLLFLYILLVLAIDFYLYSKEHDLEAFISRGLLAMIAGIAALLLWLIVHWTIGWWREHRAERGAKPATPRLTPDAGHLEQAALALLLKEADQRLVQAQVSPGEKPVHVSDLPLYLVLGPVDAGKTTALHCSGIEPSLLAGDVERVDTEIASTQVANLWLVPLGSTGPDAKRSLFLEIAGRVFDDDSHQLADFVSTLEPQNRLLRWKSWVWGQRRSRVQAALLFFDIRQFMNSPEASKLHRIAAQVRDRLSAITKAVGSELPVYVLFTRIDAVEYSEEFFAHLTEEESAQVVGQLSAEIPPLRIEGPRWAEAETGRLKRQFQSLILRLSDRRLQALTQEPRVERKPAIYQFPREFKKIRTPLIQFLIDVFKPEPLGLNAQLRGFFFVGLRKTERTMAGDPDLQTALSSSRNSLEVTQMFMGDRTALLGASARPSGPDQGQKRAMFLMDFFTEVLSRDRVSGGVLVQSNSERHRRIVMKALAVLTMLVAVVWTISWIGNRQMTAKVQTAIEKVHHESDGITLGNLRALEDLRGLLLDLELKSSLWLHWGLYVGDDLRSVAHRAYFERLKQLALNQIDQTLGKQLAQVGTGVEVSGTAYDHLKTYRTITTRACSPVDQPLICRVLKESTDKVNPGLGAEQAKLLYTQLDFYASRLDTEPELPVLLAIDPDAEAKAQAYFRKSNGLDQQLENLLADLGRQMKPVVVADHAPDYTLVLSGNGDVAGIFTKDGFAAFEDRLQKGLPSAGERCVLGDSVVSAVAAWDLGTTEKLRSLYLHRYAKAWREFIDSYKVNSFSDPADGARRLKILDSPQSPLLKIIKLVAINTDFGQAKPREPGLREKAGKVEQGLGLSRAARIDSKLQKASGVVQQFRAGDIPAMTPADLTHLFQPASYTTPADSDSLTNERNVGYVQGLRALEAGLEDLHRAMPASETEQGSITQAIAQAQKAKEDASAAQRTLADKFYDVGTDGLNRRLADLLDQPIRLAGMLIPLNPGNISRGKREGDLKRLCAEIAPIQKKYPFTSTNDTEATLEDIIQAFAPAGRVLQYAKQLEQSGLLIRKNQKWEQIPSPQGVTLASKLLQFLNRAQQLTDAFFPEGGSRPSFTYNLRPVMGQTVVVRLVLDGDEITSQTSFQKGFSWPARHGKTAGAAATEERTEGPTGFGSYPSLWGVFRLFGNADPRDLNVPAVRWSRVQGLGKAAPQTLTPPAKVELLDFPSGADVFNPKFWQELRGCPTNAVD